MPAQTAERSKDEGTERRRVRAILARCRAAKVQLVRFLYCGNDSVIRGKACHIQFLNSYLRSGIGLTVMQSFNMLDQLAPEGSFGARRRDPSRARPRDLRRPAGRAADALRRHGTAHVKNLIPHHSIYSYGRMQEVWLDR